MEPAAASLRPRPAGTPHAMRPAASVDVCHVGVALRALLFVHATVGAALLFASDGFAGWLIDLAGASSLATPATLAWLLFACAMRRRRLRASAAWQRAMGISLGAGCAWLAGWPLASLGFGTARSSLAVPVAGAAFAAVFLLWLELRAAAQEPAQRAAQLRELQARVQPHFLFNTLNTAAALVRSDPRRAEGVLEDLADLFRAALADGGEAGTDGVSGTLGDELDVARRYLAIEQLRFGERLRVRWSLDPAADGAAVPPLALQPLVENAVRHGIEACERGGEIAVETKVEGGRAIIRVTNSGDGGGRGDGVDGNGGHRTPGHGIGLESVRRRLALMHDVEARFSAGPAEGGGWRVEFAVPLAHTP